MLKKGDKKVIRGWVFYDWANSVYNLVISSAIFPIFYDNITTRRFKEEYFGISDPDVLSSMELPEGVNVTVDFLGLEMSSSVLLSWVLSASFLVVAFLSPMLSGVADFSGNKKRFMQFFNYLGASACISLYWFNYVL
jgi:MFS transporter, UMF1 family